MNFERHTNRRLFEEHAATLTLLARTEAVFTGRAGGFPPRADDAGWRSFAVTLAGAIEGEVTRHFDFEEQDLFPLLERAGEADLVALLEEEHVTILAAARPLAILARRSLETALSAAEWQTMKTLALEFAERLGSHAQKEDGALLPLLEELLDAETDRDLFGAYVATA
jgi:hemerythrin-like domain-containing protein